ncbi:MULTISPECIES: hypothetical protein [Thermoanaerobacterium]|uniref:Uncharacterized protein n=2 Tax=Thermoanaerobacterium TaxID=28895 RepID=W9EH51_9THEO|nr:MULTISPECIES: hypothetical protein [Thermoanaerobacterium]AFK86112.1 hypothetical protein Tsac_1099 [Thermoanaerobacterium saccharolyticum JW/SL-YS485]ETO39044.1 hypothetical protein V518_0819 [Thermoanaerobacterium aotearoense SCUT27]
MKGEGIKELKKYLSIGKPLKVCILDNNSVEFLTWVRKNVSPEKIFSQYDMILIPKWVWVEVCDSDNRKSYINDLKHYSKVQIIDEVDYLTLVDYKEAELYYLFLYCCYNVSRLVSFIKKNILKNRPVEDLDPYEEWLNIFYEEGLDQRKLSNGRIQKKNAGEISIAVLSYILSYYYSGSIDTITIFSSDRDTYEFVSKAKEILYKDERFKDRSNTSITFKSNDFLIYEWTRLGYINEDNIDAFVDNYRQTRRIKFTRKKQDNSIEEQDKLIENTVFLEMLKDSTIHLIF